ncbi:MAG: nucleotide pyrophosphohydrolase [Candidatus Roizmanbacteria bacterium]
MKPNTFDQITVKIRKFVAEREWDQFQKPKDLALSLTLEAAEVLEHFQWKNEDEIAEHLKKSKDDLADELVDTLWYLLALSDKIGVNLETAFERKLKINQDKYPISKAKGNNKKYTDY